MSSKINHAAAIAPALPRRAAVRVFLALACAGAGYLLFLALTGAVPIGCGAGSTCSEVLASRWAYWFGLPVSAPALALYLALFAATFNSVANGSSVKTDFTLRFSAVGSAVVIAAAAWFVILQLVIVRSWCRFCLATHVSATIAAFFILRAPGRASPAKLNPRTTADQPGMNPVQTILIALLAFAALLAGQILSNAPQNRIATIERPSQPDIASGPVRSSRVLRLHGAQFQLNADALPGMGSSTATNFIVSLFDYTCHHCRDLHHHLRAIEPLFSGRLAVISLPMPLDSACNPVIRSTPEAHVNACQYARLGLAVWRAHSQSFPEFDDWVFAPEKPPTIEQTRQKAESLVGKAALDLALNDGWVDQQIQRDIELYLANARAAGGSGMPQLVVGKAVSRGPVAGTNELIGVIGRFLQLQPGPGAMFAP